MTDNTENLVDDLSLRSKKYSGLSDDEIIALTLKQLPQRDKIFLLREIDHRGLETRIKDEQVRDIKKSMFNKPVWKIIVPIFIALFFLSKRMLSNF